MCYETELIHPDFPCVMGMPHLFDVKHLTRKNEGILLEYTTIVYIYEV